MTGEDPGGDLIARVKRQLQDQLPAYSLPAEYRHLDRLPINANGKIDRAALLARRPRLGRPLLNRSTATSGSSPICGARC